MRFTLTFIAVAGAFSAATASLVGRQSIPSCAANCLAKADFGSCSQADNACLCKSQPFINSTTVCIEAACSGQDLANAEAYSQAICKSVGVTLTNSGAAATATSSGSSTAAGAAASHTGAALATNANVLTGAAAVGFGVLALVL